jgi:hypothetical protein
MPKSPIFLKAKDTIRYINIMEYTQLDKPFVPLGSGVPRSEGLHLTDVMKSLEQKLGLGYKEGGGFEDRYLTMEMGFWWEDVLEFAFARRHAVRPDEVICDGIAGSPDGIAPDTGLRDSDGDIIVDPSYGLMLEEYKLTWKSAKTKIKDVWKYIIQTKAYCYMLGLDRVLFKACYVFGYWNGKGPLYREAYIIYTKEELESNWNMLLNHAKEEGML